MVKVCGDTGLNLFVGVVVVVNGEVIGCGYHCCCGDLYVE